MLPGRIVLLMLHEGVLALSLTIFVGDEGSTNDAAGPMTMHTDSTMPRVHAARMVGIASRPRA